MRRRLFLGVAGIAPILNWIASPCRCRAQPGGFTSDVYVGEKPTSVIKLAGPGRRAGAVAFTPDGSCLVVGHDDGSVHRYNASSGLETGQFPARGPNDPIHAIAFAPDGLSFAIAAAVEEPDRPGASPDRDDSVSIFDDRGRETRRLSRMSGKILAVAFSKNGERIAAIDHAYVAQWWKVDDGSQSAVSVAHRANGQQATHAAARVGFSADLERVVVVNDCREGDYGGALWSQIVRLVEPGGREPRMIRSQGGTDTIASVALSADGSRVLTAFAEHWILYWDFATVRHVGTNYTMIPLGVAAKNRRPAFAAFSPDDRRIVLGSERYAWVHEEDRGKKGGAMHTFEGPGGCIRAVAFLRDRVRFASGGFAVLDDQLIEGTQHPRYEPVTMWDVQIPEKK